jgi:hypothetical protein
VHALGRRGQAADIAAERSRCAFSLPVPVDFGWNSDLVVKTVKRFQI